MFWVIMRIGFEVIDSGIGFWIVCLVFCLVWFIFEQGVFVYSWGFRYKDGIGREGNMEIFFCIYKRQGYVRGSCSFKGNFEYWVLGS